MSAAVRAWHWLPEDRRLTNGDGRLVRAGRVYTYDGEPELCLRGLHASIDPLHAVSYAPGPIVCRVECSDKIVRGDDKLACTRRKVLWCYDATDVLRAFARRCALDVVHLWAAPEVVVRYLRTGDEAIRDAAWDAAWDAARDAAWSARDAAWSARDAAWSARAAARDAAWDRQSVRLARMLGAGRRRA